MEPFTCFIAYLKWKHPRAIDSLGKSLSILIGWILFFKCLLEPRHHNACQVMGWQTKTLGLCLVTAGAEVGFAVKSEPKLRMRHWKTQTCLLISRAGLTIRHT